MFSSQKLVCFANINKNDWCLPGRLRCHCCCLPRLVSWLKRSSPTATQNVKNKKMNEITFSTRARGGAKNNRINSSIIGVSRAQMAPAPIAQYNLPGGMESFLSDYFNITFFITFFDTIMYIISHISCALTNTHSGLYSDSPEYFVTKKTKMCTAIVRSTLLPKKQRAAWESCRGSLAAGTSPQVNKTSSLAVLGKNDQS